MIINKSIPQYEIWLDNFDKSNTPLYNVGGVGFINGKVDYKLFYEALEFLIQTSHSLRFCLQKDGNLKLKDNIEPPIKFNSFSNKSKSDMLKYCDREFNIPFLLNEDELLWRVELFYLNENLFGFSIKFHHIIMDGWATSIFIQHLADIYTLLKENIDVKSTFKISKSNYLDFIKESNEYLNSNMYVENRKFWNSKINVNDVNLIEKKHSIDKYSSVSPVTLFKDYMKEEGEFSIYHTFLISIAIYFNKIFKKDKVIIGIPTLNRSGKKYKQVLGMFVNVVPLVIDIKKCTNIIELYNLIKIELKEAYRNHKYPISHLFRDMNLISQKKEHIFDIVLSFEKQDYAVNFADAKLEQTYQLFSSVTKYPLAITISDFHHKQDIEIIYQASKEYFSNIEIELLSNRIKYIIKQIVNNKNESIENINLIPKEEKNRLISISKEENFNLKEAHLTFIENFELQVKNNPNQIALLSEDKKLTYKELNSKANLLAHYLKDNYTLQKDEIIPIALNRSVEMVYAILAVAKVGCAFLILDITAPINRLKKIVKNSNSKLLITSENSIDTFREVQNDILLIDKIEFRVDEEAKGNLKDKPLLTNLAYVIFTSGSTGEPKGVMIEHKALSTRLEWIRDNFEIKESDCFGQTIQPMFDPFFIELLAPLISGASVALSPSGKNSAQTLVEFAIKFGVTFIAFVPSTLHTFLLEAKKQAGVKLKRACTGGERLSPELFKLFKEVIKDGKLYNVYGPTEATIFATAWQCKDIKKGLEFPIGEPIDGTYIYILDENRNILPLGEVGEIFIGGLALARGYLNQEELSEQKFIKNPFIEDEKLYATGDYGYFNPNDTNLYFKGRIDRQEKINGYRVELNEIEITIAKLDIVSRVATKIVEVNGQKNIYSWIVTNKESNENIIEVVYDFLNRELPFYMIPKGIFIVDELQEDRNGKIDYHSLNIPSQKYESSSDRVLSSLEIKLIKLWEDVLNLKDVNIDDNFFERGGSSLSALSIIAGIDKINNKKNSLLLLLENQTIKQLASVLSQDVKNSYICLPINDEESKELFFLISSSHNDMVRFKDFINILQNRYNIYILQPPTKKEYERLEELANIYYLEMIEVIKKYDKDVHIAGFSIGGVVALEVYRELQNNSIRVKEFFLIDTIFPNFFVKSGLGFKHITKILKKLNSFGLRFKSKKLNSLINDIGLMNQIEALAHYRPKELKGEVTLIVSSKLFKFHIVTFKPWGKYLNIKSIERIDGFHGTIFRENRVDRLVEIIDKNYRELLFDVKIPNDKTKSIIEEARKGENIKDEWNENFRKLNGSWSDFPTLEEIRKNDIDDLKREKF